MGNSETKKKHIRISAVSIMHYIKLVYRTALFLVALYWYIASKFKNLIISISFFNLVEDHWNWIILGIGIVYTIEMLLRLFPSKLESPGCQKQFKRNYKPTGDINVVLHDNNAVGITALIWITLNGIIGALYMVHILDQGILWLICLLYGICDMICILFFCPFQTWFLKNRCCSSCRIYNWDFAMMFTPLFFIPGIFSWWLLGLAIIILIKWELTVWLYPERFSENTNQYLKCANCTEKLCAHKKQLRSFRRGLSGYADKQIKRILAGTKLEGTYSKIETAQQARVEKNKISRNTQLVKNEKQEYEQGDR